MTTRTLKLVGTGAFVVIIALGMGGRSEAQWYPPYDPGYPPYGPGRQHVSPFTPPLIDPSNGCEGGSCVIIPR